MKKRISATEARVHFGEILRAVQDGGETVIVERSGREAAVILPIAEYRRIGERQASGHWRDRIAALHSLWLNELAGRRVPDAVAAIRQGRRERDAQLDELVRR